MSVQTSKHGTNTVNPAGAPKITPRLLPCRDPRRCSTYGYCRCSSVPEGDTSDDTGEEQE